MSKPKRKRGRRLVETLRRRRLRERRYPIWSARSMSVIAMLSTIATLALVLWLGRTSVWAELEMAVGILAVLLLIVLTTGLYRGVKLRREGPGDLQLGDGSPGDFVPDALGSSLPDGIDADDPISLLLAIVLWFLVSLLLVVLVWLAAAVVWLVIAVVFVAYYYVFSRALRQVFRLSRRCQGNLPRSVAYAALYTFLYTGWLAAVLFVGHALAGRA